MPSSSKEEWVYPSSPKKEGVIAMLLFFLSSVESCGGGHSISSKEEEVWHSSPKKDPTHSRAKSCFHSTRFLFKKGRYE